MIFRLVYFSQRTECCDAAGVHSIVETSRAFNFSQRITGVLYCGEEMFLQCLEGNRTAVNRLYHRIVRDIRHQDLHVVHCDENPGRLFGKWSMGNIPQTEEVKDLFIRHFGKTSFYPTAIACPGVLGFLRDAAALIPST